MNMDYANATLPQIMPTNAYTIGSRHEEKHAHETLVANLPAHIINTYLDGNKGWRNTKAAHGALAYIQELEAANVRLRVEIGWLTEDNEEMKGKLDETERRLQEGKRQNGVLQELLEERMKADEEGARGDDEVREGLDHVSLGDESGKGEAGKGTKQ